MPIQAISNSGSSAAEEARETAAQSRTEAANGDRQAIQRLARMRQQAPDAAPVNPPGTGTIVNVKA